jgi:hypothetical protein
MITIVTPCCRQKNLPSLFESIDFSKIDKWIIIYDTSKNRTYSKLYENPQIVEDFCNDVGISGNPQRNYGVKLIKEGLIYFLDDDNIIHPDFWTLNLNEDYFYTFDQNRNKKGLIWKGNNVRLNCIDTAMFIVPKKMFFDWKINEYAADGLFIEEVLKENKEKHIYIPKVACYYNFLR